MSIDPIRVVVAEDSLTVRKHIVDILTSDPRFEVVGEAPDGKTAIELCELLRPDVVSMDMMLPIMTGMAATEYIMAYCPTPILIVSASTNRGELFKTYDALAAGAVDVLEKPRGDEPTEEWEGAYLGALRRVSRIRVITHVRARLTRPGPERRASRRSMPTIAAGTYRAVAIGASTGGPGALLTVLRPLPADFSLPVLVVLHIADPFGEALAQWLDAQIPLEVRTAVDGERLPPVGKGCVLMARPDHHLELDGDRIALTDGPPRNFCRPSVDVMFESLARELGDGVLACLLTGMGKDGAQGLLALREAGAETLAQDEVTSVVFGMPAEAIRLGAAKRILPIEQFGPALVRAAKGRRSMEGD